MEFERRTLRTVRRDSCNTRAISRLLTPFALSSRIAVRCAWLSMLGFLFLSDSCRHPVQFPARTFDLALRLFLLRAIHLRQGFGEPPAGAMQDGNRHLQIALESGRGRPGWPAAAAAFSKTVPARRGCARGPRASRPARRHRVARLAACRNGAGRKRRPSARSLPR